MKPPSWAKSVGGFVAASHAPPSDDAFEKHILSKQVDLFDLIEKGIPPIEYLPESDGMFIKGKRHLIAAERKEGKSIGMLVHAVEMALAGAHVVILDRENGANEYARRLGGITTVRLQNLRRGSRDPVKRNLQYYAYPQFKEGYGERFAEWAREQGVDLVVFDSCRMFLTMLELRENESDDFSQFMDWIVMPLSQAEIATLILDNTGHGEPKRARGTSAKGDLNEVLFTLKAVKSFSIHKQGELHLTLKAGDSRFGNDGEWEMQIGDGAFSPWVRAGEAVPPAFRKAAEDALEAAGLKGLSQTSVLQAIRAEVSFTQKFGGPWLQRMAGDDSTNISRVDGRFYGGRSAA